MGTLGLCALDTSTRCKDSCSMEPITGMEDIDVRRQQVCSICFNKTTLHENEEITSISPAASPPYSPSDTTTQPNWFSSLNKASNPFPHGVSVQCSNLKCDRFIMSLAPFGLGCIWKSAEKRGLMSRIQQTDPDLKALKSKQRLKKESRHSRLKENNGKRNLPLRI